MRMQNEAHLASIEEHGLLSARAASDLGIVPDFPGGSRLTQILDADRRLDDMVFLSFFNRGVMPKHDDARLRRPVLLKIDARVLFRRGVQVALGRANRRSTMIYRAAGAYYKMDWNVIFGEADETNISERWRISQVFDYEVLVPNRVPVEYILGFA
jgi:ssDNA thymidine ADP-ribosyltransferase, DarT